MTWPARRGKASSRGDEVRVAHDDPSAPEIIAVHLRRLLDGPCPPRLDDTASAPPERAMLILCIGTDRSTGDALGPLVGQHLSAIMSPGLAVLGTLDHPVHASNLTQVLDQLDSRYRGWPVVAVDACLGQYGNVGTITIAPGALRPGAGVNKSLPPVGDIFITGTVNVGGMMEYLVLQNTRLSLVMRMAHTIAASIIKAARGSPLPDNTPRSIAAGLPG